MTQDDPQASWNTFVRSVREARQTLGCSTSSAWFRGHADGNYRLLPSLYRLRPRLTSDLAAAAKKLEGRIQSLRERIEKIRAEPRFVNWTSPVTELVTTPAEASQCSNDGGPGISFSASRMLLQKLIEERVTAQREIKVVRSIRYGEEDAFGAYGVEFDRRHLCSWQRLADMQHYKVPTRLLDWSTSFSIGVFFAIEKLLRRVQHPNEMRQLDLLFEYAKDFDEAPPCLWVLNPYKLARSAGLGNWVGDITLRPDLDYYSSFFRSKNWPFARSIPALIPRTNDRIEAQQGCFTIQGLNATPMEDLNNHNNYCQKIVITRAAAAYGAYVISEEHGLDQYAIYRDFDSFGERILHTYLSPPVPVLLISNVDNQKYFGSLLDGEFQLTRVDRVHDTTSKGVTALNLAKGRLAIGDPFDAVLFDMDLGYSRYEACLARLGKIVKRIIAVDKQWTYRDLVLALRN